MATFSPSPAPRRSTRLQSRPPGYSPPVVQPRRQRGAGSSGPASRFTSPARNHILEGSRLQAVADDASYRRASSSGAGGMDVDDDNTSLIFERAIRSETVFAKSQQMAVSFYSHLPAEVKQVLKNADFYRDSYTGDVDPVTGYALVASSRTCFVWNHAQALVGTPTCYIFACPSSDNSCPFHALIPYGPTREPGLILASASGEIRLWDSIGIGLAGGDHYSTLFLELHGNDGEVLTTLTRVDTQTFVASTSVGRLFRLVLTSTGGKYHLASHPFARPQYRLSLTRIFPLWSSSAPQTERGYINSVSLGKQTTVGREIWTVIDTRVQIWSMTFEGFEELVIEEDLGAVIQRSVQDTVATASKDGSELDLELLDVVVESSVKVVFLVSYAGLEETYSMVTASQPKRNYALVRVSFVSDVFKVDSVKSVPYQSTSSSGAPMHPRLQAVQKGALIAIQFGDAVALCARDTEYIDRLELKSATDRTLGVGVLGSEGELLILTAATMMKVYVDMDQIAKFDRETGRATLIKSIMMQAILYGSYSENPLHFSFPPEIDEESLMTGAEQLSRAILESDPEVVRPSHDINALMVGRMEKLGFLVKFINDNAALGKMSQSSRQRLATDAGKLYASHRLWLQHNEFLASGHRRSILNEAVYAYMNDVGERHHEDFMRAFFRLSVRDVGELLTWIMHLLSRLERETANLQNIASVLCEANKATLTILTSAMEFRSRNLGVYGVDLPMHDPWTSQPETIDFVVRLFELTTKVVDSSVSGAVQMDVDSGTGRDIPRAQLAELSSLLFGCYHERLEWLKSPAAANEPGTEREKNALQDRFNQLRPEVLDILRNRGQASHAFKLAEDYRDFRSLASLCHKDQVYPPEENPHAIRIQSYIDQFKEEFTTELYRWYIEHGELRSMFAQSDAYSGYLDKFFTRYPHPCISWIHHLDKKRYGEASTSLLAESSHVVNLETKHLILSIGKLAHLAQIQDDRDSTAIDKSALDAFHDGLDIVSVHETLLEEFRNVKTRTKQSLESQVDTIFKKKASRLVDRSAHTHIFKLLARQIVQGKALSNEDIIEVLSLKDNEDSMEDFVTALYILPRIHGLPESRQINAFRNVWRRIYLHDDWNAIRQTVDVTDSELNDKYRRTALYAALRAGPKYIVEPQQALGIPSVSEISSRWPGMPPDMVEVMEQDYQIESERLKALELENDFARVAELAVAASDDHDDHGDMI